MAWYIDKSTLVAKIENRIKELQNLHKENEEKLDSIQKTAILLCIDECKVILSFIDALEVKEMNFESENENTNQKITVGTKIRLKANPGVILSIISNDCHGDEFECSNGSVLSLKQIEKYYDICNEEK